MKRYETLETLFGKVDLSFAEKVLNEAYHPKGSPGMPVKTEGLKVHFEVSHLTYTVQLRRPGLAHEIMM